MSGFSERDLRSAMGHFCSGVVIVTGLRDGVPAGFTAQSFVSVSLDPPLVSICPARSSRSWPTVRGAGHFCINILGADQRGACELFARSAANRFADIGWRSGVTGAPILSGVLGAIECRLEAEHEAGDHTIVVGRVLDLGIFDLERGPLLFFRGGYGDFKAWEVA